MNAGGNVPVSTPSPVAGQPFNSRALSAVAGASVALILLCIFWCFVWQSKKHAARNDGNSAASSTAPPPTSSSRAAACRVSVDEERGENGTAQLPVFVHVATPGAAEKLECAVCLVEFGDGEAGRLVPGCGHGFHAACIQTWFRVRSTCPLCRAAVSVVEPAPRLERG